jgi:hypothetical protein
MLDAVLFADTAEDMADPSQRTALVALSELHAVISQDGVDPVGTVLFSTRRKAAAASLVARR